ncbi:nibrin [Leptopilina heterotoma]|uniref:nibrin n=1 Tax=Leptopilina heterotoma TaxID=63436 RepID=UPI001CA91D4B|nr:nibrin [Leptopilina heterotoma]
MWFLKGPKGELIYLKRDSPINVGRIQGDIVLRDDKSISRNHASVYVEPKKNKNKSLCFVKDMGSKYGSTVNRGNETIKITKEGIEVHHNDIIKFGLQNNDYTASYIPMVVLVSSMTDIKHLQSIINDLDGYIVLEWSKDVTHLTTVKAKLREKIAIALVNCVPIVGIEYWEAVKIAVKENKDLPKFSDYILPISEDIIDNTKVSLAPNKIRRSLFKDLTFLFFSYSQLNIYKKIVNDAGGESLMFNKSVHTDLNKFCTDNFAVVYYMIGSNQTEESILETQKTKTAYEEIEELLRKSKRRMISDSEIMLAILHCSLEKNCNSKHKYKEWLLEKKSNASKDDRKTIFAVDTDDLHSKSLIAQNNDNIVPESVEMTSQDLVDTQWSGMGDNNKAPPASLGISDISSIKSETQLSTEDIDSQLAKLNVDKTTEKRTEKRSSELVCSTPAKRAKISGGSSLFPVVSKKSSQSLLNSQEHLVSQIPKLSQLSNRNNDSIIIDYDKKSSSQSQNKFTLPSTLNDSGKQKAKANIFGNWMEAPKASKIEIIEETDTPKRKTQIDKNDSTSMENKAPKREITRSNDSSSNALSFGSKNKRRESNSSDTINDSVKDKLIDEEEPQTKKRKINVSNDSSLESNGRSEKRKRDTRSDSDSNQFVMQKKRNQDDNEKVFRIEAVDNLNSNDDDCLIVTGLIRDGMNDPSINDTIGYKTYKRANYTIPRMRISLDGMVAWSMEEE